jgi:hypothetical protein
VLIEVPLANFSERNLRLDHKFTSVDGRHVLLLEGLRFPHRDFVAETEWNRVLLRSIPVAVSFGRYGRIK